MSCFLRFLLQKDTDPYAKFAFLDSCQFLQFFHQDNQIYSV
jgi:hypothetical protein